jgi:hypothetical protein
VKHSPAPWLIEYEQGDMPYITADQGNPKARWNNPVICALYEDVTPEDSVTIGPWLKAYPNAEANARLLVKAPQLLAELKFIHDAWPEADDDEEINGADMVDWYCEIRAGLKKLILEATGEPV